jgi:hypothetical protein
MYFSLYVENITITCEALTDIFLPILVDSQVNSSKRSSTNFIFNNILVDTVLSMPVVLAIVVGGACVECLADLAGR